MQFLIADTFSDSLARLTGEEQKLVKTAAFDFQLHPTTPGSQLHRVENARDKGFWSARVGRDLRLIVHQGDGSRLLCYVGHHDDAYRWAERRKLERHPRTGAMQLVEVRETVREIDLPVFVEPKSRPAKAKPALLTHVTDDDLLGYGVPPEWLADARKATEDTLLDVCEHLPREAAEALMELATGARPPMPQLLLAGGNPFEHPDAQRRFHAMTSVEDLKRALDSPWDKWMVFLHPAQRELVSKRFNGPCRVAGSAGTGKTVVAIHRAVHLANTKPSARVLLTTFSPVLAGFLRQRLAQLTAGDETVADRMTVLPIGQTAHDVYAAALGAPKVANAVDIADAVATATRNHPGSPLSAKALIEEWQDVVDAWQLVSWDQYRAVQRLGRKTRLNERQRGEVWPVMEAIRSELKASGLVTSAEVFATAADVIKAGSAVSPFEYAVVDEAQDLSVQQLRFLGALGAGKADGLMFAGDLGQRIFQTPFSWKSLGVDIRGRSHVLRINYRTSHQIRSCADRLLPGELADVDGVTEQRKGAVSVFTGPQPEFLRSRSEAAEVEGVVQWVRERLAAGIRPDELGIFVRSAAQLPRARRVLQESGQNTAELDLGVVPSPGQVSISTMHLAKGLEFRAVVVMAVDEGVMPLAERIEGVADTADLEEVYSAERHLLYVACTRARDYLLVSGIAPVSEFLDDMDL